MQKKPLLVSIVSWTIIALTVILAIVYSLAVNNSDIRNLMSRSPVPINVQITLTYTGMVVFLISGIFMLQAQDWARWLYVGWGFFGLMFTFFGAPNKLSVLPGLIIYLIVITILFLPESNRYFSEE